MQREHIYLNKNIKRIDNTGRNITINLYNLKFENQKRQNSKKTSSNDYLYYTHYISHYIPYNLT